MNEELAYKTVSICAMRNLVTDLRRYLDKLKYKLFSKIIHSFFWVIPKGLNFMY
jgi:hypothetical protein